MKMNSLLDAPSIRALYRASQAGVEVRAQRARDLRAAPRRARASPRTSRVTSVVGRFLEHSRIYSFERHGETPSVYIGSADLMPRNLYNRVELVTPISTTRSAPSSSTCSTARLADNTNSWELGADGSWTRRRPDGEPRIRPAAS